MFADRYGPWAVVTGAAEGMGAAFATDLVGRGVSVVLVDRDGELLAKKAAELPGSRAITVDLGSADGPSRLLEGVADLEVGLLVSNAAVSHEGPFVDQTLEKALGQLDINCRVPLILVHSLLPGMVERGRGGMILLSSMSAWRGAPLVACYAATKAWNLILAESLWEEVRAQGVDVMAVLPGSTRTPGFLGSRPQSSFGTAHLMDPSDVVSEALDALGTAPSMTPGKENRDSEGFMAAMSRYDAIAMMGDVMRQMYPSPVRAADPKVV